jgi:hypothetical protein
MTKRGQTPRQASGGKFGGATAGASWDHSSSVSEGEEGHREKMTPIERIFEEEVGREMEPEEREILLGTHAKRRKSRSGSRKRAYGRNR